MKTAFYLFIVLALCASCSTTKKTMSSNAGTTTSVERDGSSFDKAILIHQDHERPGIADEYAWLRDKYPGYKNRGQALSMHGNKPYDILNITTTDGKEVAVYFDISNFYGKF